MERVIVTARNLCQRSCPALLTDWVAHLQPRGVKRSFPAGSLLFFQDDPPDALYLLLEGEVVLEKHHPQGEPLILCRHQSGGFFCPLAVLDGSPQLGTAKALTDVTVLVVPREEVIALLRDNPQALEELHAHCFRRVRHLLERLHDGVRKPLRQRVAQALLEHAEPGKEGGLVVRTTHQMLAQWVGCSREALSRELVAMRQAGWIQTRRGAILLLQPQQLKQCASDGAL